MKKVITVVLLVAALAAIAYFSLRLMAKRQTINVLKITGNIESHDSVVGFKVQGRLVELPVQEGQYVSEGDLIARLDSNDYLQQVNIDEATFRSREAQLALSLAGSREQDIKAAEQSLLDAQADLELKKIEFQRNQAQYEINAVSAETRDTAATNLKRAQAVYERNRQTYNELVEGTRKEQIAIDRTNVSVAQQNLELSRIQLGYTVLHAPTSGVVTVRQAELGEVMAPGTPVVTISDLDHIWLRGYISETDLERVRWGQPATITTDSYQGETFHGRVSFIASDAEFTPKSVETHQERVTLVYRIKIDIDNPTHELVPGIPADAKIDLAPP